MDAIIRRAGPDDAAGIARVHTLGWQQGFAELLPADFLARREVSPQSWVEWLTRSMPRSAVFVAEVDAEVVGFALVGPVEEQSGPRDDELGELKAIYLLAPFWGAGIGYRLHRAGLTALLELGYHRAQLSVLAENRRTQEFYRRQGWLDDGAEVDADLGGVTARVRRMRHDLTGPLGERPQSSSAR